MCRSSRACVRQPPPQEDMQYDGSCSRLANNITPASVQLATSGRGDLHSYACHRKPLRTRGLNEKRCSSKEAGCHDYAHLSPEARAALSIHRSQSQRGWPCARRQFLPLRHWLSIQARHHSLQPHTFNAFGEEAAIQPKKKPQQATSAG